MKWRGRQQSSNIEDRRRAGPSRGGAAGVGGLGAVVVVVIALFLGVDPSQLLNQMGGTQGASGGSTAELSAEEKTAGEFVSVTLRDTEVIWSKIFREQLGRDYQPATLVLFRQGTVSACGGASEATGPFYCPADKKVYLDTSFFATLHKMGGVGDFAAAYVVAHEIGHHVQGELGILGKANSIRQQVGEAESNQISVMIELQADCLSGIWAREAKQAGTLDRGDLQEALQAAASIGDDTLQANAGRRPMPDSFTHGTSEQRMRWFETGLNSGQLEDCDTFQAAQL